jgi:ParB family chromosome partitioning protein
MGSGARPRESCKRRGVAKFDRILENTPAIFTTAQLRVFLRALVNLAPYTFADDVAERFAAEDENNDKSAEEILLATVDGLTDDKLTGFALRLVLTGNTPIPREGEGRFLDRSRNSLRSSETKEDGHQDGKGAYANTQSRRAGQSPVLYRTEITVRKMLTAVETSLYDIGV